MNNAVVWPLLLPLLTGVMLILIPSLRGQRIVSGAGALANVAVSALLVKQVKEGGIQTLHMGGWIPPFGIIFVADMAAALLVLAASVVTAACVFYAFCSIGEAREKHHFYTFVQFLSVGVTGSFLTGDLFNLFVCFEVMLISSYALIVLGGKTRQLRESIKYIIVNIVSSTLFVATLAYLYAALGTLNMAHLAERVAEAGQGGTLNVIAVLLLTVFSLKAGLFLFFWLPGSYTAPPPVIAALFAGLLTKVGVYAIVRTFTLIFAYDPAFTQPLIGWMSSAAMLLGGIGAVAYRDIWKIAVYNIVAAVGLVGYGVSAATNAALDGVLFYLLHDMAAKALLFLLCGWLAELAGTSDLNKMGAYIGTAPALGWIFFITGIAIAGVPPFSGFVGKYLILQGGFAAGRYVGATIALASGLLILLSLIRIFMGAFWGEPKAPRPETTPPSGLLAPCAILAALLVLMGAGAEFANDYISLAGETLASPERYINAVLKED